VTEGVKSHRIRLPAPWVVCWADGSRQARGRAPGSAGRGLEFRRVFHAPRGLSAAQRVWLELEWDADAHDWQVELNQRACPLVVHDADVARVDIGGYLQPTNQLVVRCLWGAADIGALDMGALDMGALDMGALATQPLPKFGECGLRGACLLIEELA
jgi:hypothetical protein